MQITIKVRGHLDKQWKEWLDNMEIKRETGVMDIIYNPQETKFMGIAREKGCKVINGFQMFINQGAEQFSLWTGENPPIDIMKKAVENVLY